MLSSAAILERYRSRLGGEIDLTLRPAYRDLLVRLGDPHKHLPPVFHVAGTNGKGSTCAFLRAMLEAAGYRVHVFTSPHLVTFHERIRVAGSLIGEAPLTALLEEAQRHAGPDQVTLFELTTAVAFAAFARMPADFTIIEVGLGGRLDATNVIDRPVADIIARLSFDHRDFLGDTIDKIAREKAGIMRRGVPCFTAEQPDPLAAQTLRDAAAKTGAPLFAGGTAWQVAETASGFHFTDAARQLDLPPPALPGVHQYRNAGLAIAALAALPRPISPHAIAEGVQKVEWPARLQRLRQGRLADLLPSGAELWLDGGHNDSAGEVLAEQIERWRAQDGGRLRPLYVVTGMLTTKMPTEFLSPFAAAIDRFYAVPIPGESVAFAPGLLAEEARKAGVAAVAAIDTVEGAVRDLARLPSDVPPRILICGSLYLAGHVLTL